LRSNKGISPPRPMEKTGRREVIEESEYDWELEANERNIKNRRSVIFLKPLVFFEKIRSLHNFL
jgi:hypothetical protein